MSDAELDLYLFDCTGKRCVTAASTLGLGSAPRVRRLQPRPGLWKVVVDASRVPEGGIAFDYRDAVGEPALGAVSVTDASLPRKVGERWRSTANVWLARRPDAGRDPHALLIVGVTDGATTVPVGLRLVPIEVKGSDPGGRVRQAASRRGQNQ